MLCVLILCCFMPNRHAVALMITLRKISEFRASHHHGTPHPQAPRLGLVLVRASDPAAVRPAVAPPNPPSIPPPYPSSGVREHVRACVRTHSPDRPSDRAASRSVTVSCPLYVRGHGFSCRVAASGRAVAKVCVRACGA